MAIKNLDHVLAAPIDRSGRLRPSTSAATGAQAPPLAHMPGEYLVRFSPPALRASLATARGPAPGQSGYQLAPDSNETALLRYLRDNHGLQSAEPVYLDGPAERWASSVAGMRRVLARTVVEVDRSTEAGYAILRFDPGTSDSARVLRELQASAQLELAEPVPARWLAAPRRPDPQLNRQWGLRAIGTFLAGRLPSARQVPVAVLDSGIDRHHPLLPPSVVTHYDHDGMSADDLEGHGTHVAGTIAALHDDAVGCSGIADCPLQVWKVIADRPAADGRRYVAFGPYLRALAAVAASGAKVLNLSLSGTQSSQTEASQFRRLRAADVFVVAAMGNDFELGNPIEYPAAFSGVHGIAAVDELDRWAPFSNTGRHAFLSAPGVNILSTAPTVAPFDPAFEVSSGTSMATPHVAAVAALVRAVHPDWDVAGVAAHLAATARTAPGQRAGRRSSEFGHGIVNLASALS
jgi:serine protease